MRVFKSAFTLAEAMIAMAIIGIVAAVTIPQVVTGSLKNEAGAVLGRTVEQIELGCQNMIQKANDNIKVTDGGYYEGLSELTQQAVFGEGAGTEKMSGPGIFDNGGAFFGLTLLEDSESYLKSFKDFSGDSLTAAVKPSNNKAYLMNKQKAVVVASKTDYKNLDVDGFNTAIYIDVNGIQKPNRGGRDIFIFGLTHQGKLVPRGTADYQRYYSGAPLHTADCKKGAVKTGWSCAARVVQDGYRITYY